MLQHFSWRLSSMRNSSGVQQVTSSSIIPQVGQVGPNACKFRVIHARQKLWAHGAVRTGWSRIPLHNLHVSSVFATESFKLITRLLGYRLRISLSFSSSSSDVYRISTLAFFVGWNGLVSGHFLFEVHFLPDPVNFCTHESNGPIVSRLTVWCLALNLLVWAWAKFFSWWVV